MGHQCGPGHAGHVRGLSLKGSALESLWSKFVLLYIWVCDDGWGLANIWVSSGCFPIVPVQSLPSFFISFLSFFLLRSFLPSVGSPWARAWLIWDVILSFYESQTFLILACLKFHLRDKIPNKIFLSGWGTGVLFSSKSALSLQGAADSTYKRKLFLLLLSLRPHLDTRCLNYCPA
jgi:hypothetical protein